MSEEDLRAELEKHLHALSIQTTCVEHPPVCFRCLQHDAVSDRVLNWLALKCRNHHEINQVFTVEEMMPHLQEVNGAVTKNLFLKDKKKKSLFLVSARHDRQVNLNDLAKKLGVASGNLRFADEATMLEKLKVGPGCATALALVFDVDKTVRSVLDRDLLEGDHERVYFHPMTNTATVGLRPQDLLRFLRETGHDPVLQDFL